MATPPDPSRWSPPDTAERAPFRLFFGPLQTWARTRGDRRGLVDDDICSSPRGYQNLIFPFLESDYLTHAWNHMQIRGTLVFNPIKRLRVQPPLTQNLIPPSSLPS